MEFERERPAVTWLRRKAGQLARRELVEEVRTCPLMTKRNGWSKPVAILCSARRLWLCKASPARTVRFSSSFLLHVQRLRTTHAVGSYACAICSRLH